MECPAPDLGIEGPIFDHLSKKAFDSVARVSNQILHILIMARNTYPDPQSLPFESGNS